MKIKVAEATSRQLDWLVAKCEDEETHYHKGILQTRWTTNGYSPSTDWSQGGPIIEREGISLHHKWYNGEWHATKQVDPSHPTLPGRLHQITRWHPSNPLIAALRCYVASALGDEVEVPDEL